MKIKISAPGKVILSGEHAVVYGKPALVAAVNRRLKITIKAKGKILNIWGYSEIPIGGGMGSSAALAAVQAAAIKEIFRLNLSRKQINEIAYDLEKKYHGNPSGVDNSIVTFGGFLWYRREFPFLKNIWRLPIKLTPKLDKFVLINSGRPLETTKEMVEIVKSQMSNLKAKAKILNLFNKIEEQTKRMLIALREEKEKELKSSIKENERLLEKLRVVSQKAKEIIKKIEAIGGVAKVTGAGGLKDGSGMLLCYHKKPEELLNLAKKLKLEAFWAKLGVSGLKIEKNKGKVG